MSLYRNIRRIKIVRKIRFSRVITGIQYWLRWLYKILFEVVWKVHTLIMLLFSFQVTGDIHFSWNCGWKSLNDDFYFVNALCESVATVHKVWIRMVSFKIYKVNSMEVIFNHWSEEVLVYNSEFTYFWTRWFYVLKYFFQYQSPSQV